MLRKRIINALMLLRSSLNKETDLNRNMIRAFYLHSQGRANKEELDLANNQLKSLLKELGFGLLVSLPLSPVTIPFILSLSRKYNVDIIPDWFKDSLNK